MGQSASKEHIMYHGTTLENAQKIMCNGFIPSIDGMLGRGVYVTRSYRKACAYPIHLAADQKRAVLQLSVRVGRVKKINRQGHPLQKSWHEEGYDSAWVPPECGMVKSGLEENCIWDPNRITVLKIIKEDSSLEEPYEHGNCRYGNNQNGENQYGLFQHVLYRRASVKITTMVIAGSYHYGGFEDGDCQNGNYENEDTVNGSVEYSVNGFMLL